jgi:hypothetical protein
VLNGRAIYIWRLKNVVGVGTVDDVVQKATRAKISSLWVKIADGSRGFENTKGAVGKLLQDLVTIGVDTPSARRDQVRHPILCV